VEFDYILYVRVRELAGS